jgi:hypothetical protein
MFLENRTSRFSTSVKVQGVSTSFNFGTENNKKTCIYIGSLVEANMQKVVLQELSAIKVLIN